MKKSIMKGIASIFLALAVSNSAYAVLLTSITLDPEDATGMTTNAPGAFTTNIGDPLAPLGVASGGTFLNSPGPGFDLGEVSINLQPGINTFDLFSNGIFPSNAFYGAVLFFDGVATPPQIAVFNANGGVGGFSIQSAGTQIMGGASGGLFFDQAPGTAFYSAPDGLVEVLGFTVDSINTGTDMVSFGNISGDGTPDTVAQLSLRFTPSSVPEPSSIILFGIGIAGLIGFRKRTRIT